MSEFQAIETDVFDQLQQDLAARAARQRDSQFDTEGLGDFASPVAAYQNWYEDRTTVRDPKTGAESRISLDEARDLDLAERMRAADELTRMQRDRVAYDTSVIGREQAGYQRDVSKIGVDTAGFQRDAARIGVEEAGIARDSSRLGLEKEQAEADWYNKNPDARGLALQARLDQEQSAAEEAKRRNQESQDLYDRNESITEGNTRDAIGTIYYGDIDDDDAIARQASVLEFRNKLTPEDRASFDRDMGVVANSIRSIASIKAALRNDLKGSYAVYEELVRGIADEEGGLFKIDPSDGLDTVEKNMLMAKAGFIERDLEILLPALIDLERTESSINNRMSNFATGAFASEEASLDAKAKAGLANIGAVSQKALIAAQAAAGYIDLQTKRTEDRLKNSQAEATLRGTKASTIQKMQEAKQSAVKSKIDQIVVRFGGDDSFLHMSGVKRPENITVDDIDWEKVFGSEDETLKGLAHELSAMINDLSAKPEIPGDDDFSTAD